MSTRPQRRSEPGPAEPVLVERVSRGDATAFDALVALHVGPLRAFLAKRAGADVRARESASDLAQSVCRELIEHVRDGRFEYHGAEAFRGWLYRAAELKLLERNRHWRRERRDPVREVAAGARASDAADEFFQSLITPSRVAGAREELEAVRLAFEALSPRYRRVIELVRVNGLDHAEAGLRLGLDASASRQLLARALARLGTLLRDGARVSPSDPAAPLERAQPQ